MKGDVSQKEFVDLYKKEREMYESWGNFVADYIRKKIKVTFEALLLLVRTSEPVHY